MVWFQEKLLKFVTCEKIEKILLAYGKFQVLTFQPQSGWQNLCLKIITNSGNLILRIYRKKNLTKLEASLDVVEYLSKSAFQVPPVYKTSKGERVISVPIGKSCYYAVLFEYLEGETKVFLTKSEIIQFGELVGRLHQALAAFPILPSFGKIGLVTTPSRLNTTFSLKFQKQSQIFNLWNKFLKDSAQKFFENRKVLAQKQLIHGDLAPSNVIFRNSEIVGLLDFDEIIFAPKIWDLANFVGNYVQTFKSGGKQEKVAIILKYLIAGYEKSLKLEKKEKQILGQIVRLWLFKKILWAKGQASKKYRQDWANDVMSWCYQALEEKF